MILSLLAALSGVAQQAFVVYEGAESSHFVQRHSGSEYYWEIYKNLNPDRVAASTDCYISGADNSNEVTVHWSQAGTYYLKIIETDLSGCSNLKAIAVSVVPNDRSISFQQNSGTACYNINGNDFDLPLVVTGAGSQPLEESVYPLSVSFLVNEYEYSQDVEYDNQALSISSEMFNADPDSVTIVVVEITGAVDNTSNSIEVSTNNIHKQTLFTQPRLAFDLSEVVLNKYAVYTHQVSMISGDTENARYFWSVDTIGGTSTDLEAITKDTAAITWDGNPGEYILQVYAEDGNGCISDTVQQQVGILKPGKKIIVSAGKDTLIGSCSPYQLTGLVSDTTGLTFLWSPADNLNDPTLLNPVFTPGETTEFLLTVSNAGGIIGSGSVEIGVSTLVANAGEDLIMTKGTNVLLDGSASEGQNITYSWTTNTGRINEGSNTANPVVSQPGVYYIEITDEFSCTKSDSVLVSVYANVPIAVDDYDTAAYQTVVAIDVLANDSDPDNNLDPGSISILDYPDNGVLDIGLYEQLIYYTPNDNYTGTDVFEYQVCDSTSLCASAIVYVLVTPMNFLIPEAFTPNGDNINDYFEILGIEYYPNNSLTVINRWGQKVYEAKNYGIETYPQFWDGKDNIRGNNDLPGGTYFYVLDLGNGEKPIAGSVYIDR